MTRQETLQKFCIKNKEENKRTEAAIEEENSVAKKEKKMDKNEDLDKEAQGI